MTKRLRNIVVSRCFLRRAAVELLGFFSKNFSNYFSNPPFHFAMFWGKPVRHMHYLGIAQALIRCTRSRIAVSKISSFNILNLIASTLLIFASNSAWASKILILESSDQHSYYLQIPDFIRTTSALRKNFLAQNPDGEVVLLINGDFAGKSAWSFRDHGELGFDVLEQLQNQYKTVVVLGNHDGFDYRGEQGIKLFYDQNKRLKEAKVTTANLDLTSLGEDLFQPYTDIQLKNGETYRIVGLVFDDFYIKSSYDRKSPTQLFNDVIPMLDSAKEQILQAHRDGIHQVIFSVHDGHSQVQDMILELKKWMKSQPELAHIKIPAAFAGHNHKVFYGNVQGTQIINAGSNYEFSATVIDEEGIQSYQHYDHERQTDFRNNYSLTSYEARAIELTQARIEEIKGDPEMTRPVAITNGFKETKHDLKTGRNPLGNQLADAFALWASDVWTSLNPNSSEPKPIFLGFVNSSTYRLETPVQKGILSYLHTLSMFPFQEESRIAETTGDVVNFLYASLREYRQKREGFYAPHVPTDVRETKNFQLEILDENGKWVRLDPKAKVILAMDHWIGENGYGLEEYKFVNEMKGLNWLTPPHPLTAADVVADYFGLASNSPRNCGDALEPAAPKKD